MLKRIQNHTPSDFHSMDECLLPSVTFPYRTQMQCATPEQILNLPVRAVMLWMGSTVYHFVVLRLPGVGTMVLSHSDKE